MSDLDRIKSFAIKRNNLLLYTKENVFKLIDYLEINDIPIFGFDAFVITDNWIKPYLEFSPDYSAYKSNNEIYSIARKDILRTINENKNFLYKLVYNND